MSLENVHVPSMVLSIFGLLLMLVSAIVITLFAFFEIKFVTYASYFGIVGLFCFIIAELWCYKKIIESKKGLKAVE